MVPPDTLDRNNFTLGQKTADRNLPISVNLPATGIEQFDFGTTAGTGGVERLKSPAGGIQTILPAMSQQLLPGTEEGVVTATVNRGPQAAQEVKAYMYRRLWGSSISRRQWVHMARSGETRQLSNAGSLPRDRPSLVRLIVFLSL